MNPSDIPPTPPDATIPDPTGSVLNVDLNRRRIKRLAVIGGLTLVPTWILVFRLPPSGLGALEQFVQGLLLGGPIGLIACATTLLRKGYLRFHPVSRTLMGPSRWVSWTAYPKAKSNRLEYSVYDARIYEVQPDGKRCRLPIHRKHADQRDWEALVDLLLRRNTAPGGRPSPKVQRQSEEQTPR